MADLTTLLERVEKATRPDQELDAAIWRELDPRNTFSFGYPPYTASIDAAVALVEKMLPVFDELSIRTGPLGHSAEIHYGPMSGGEGRNPSLAILSALLRALIAKDTQDNG